MVRGPWRAAEHTRGRIGTRGALCLLQLPPGICGSLEACDAVGEQRGSRGGPRRQATGQAVDEAWCGEWEAPRTGWRVAWVAGQREGRIGASITKEGTGRSEWRAIYCTAARSGGSRGSAAGLRRGMPGWALHARASQPGVAGAGAASNNTASARGDVGQANARAHTRRVAGTRSIRAALGREECTVTRKNQGGRAGAGEPGRYAAQECGAGEV